MKNHAARRDDAPPLKQETPGGLAEGFCDNEHNHSTRKRRGAATTTFRIISGDDERVIHVNGRVEWALRQLIAAGARGVTPLERPALRWSAYIHKIRHDFDIGVETEREPHGPPFSGTHARYRLPSGLRVVEEAE